MAENDRDKELEPVERLPPVNDQYVVAAPGPQADALEPGQPVTVEDPRGPRNWRPGQALSDRAEPAAESADSPAHER